MVDPKDHLMKFATLRSHISRHKVNIKIRQLTTSLKNKPYEVSVSISMLHTHGGYIAARECFDALQTPTQSSYMAL